MDRQAKLQARKILEDLASGTPPSENIEFLTVGREKELAAVRSRIDAAAGGKPQVLFIRGDYGDGKSHLLSLLQREALQANCVVSNVVLSGREQPLHDLRRIYRKVATSLQFDGRKATIADLFEKCAVNLVDSVDRELNTRCKHGMTYGTCAHFCLGTEILNRHLPELSRHDHSLSLALALLVWSTVTAGDAYRPYLHEWLNGARLRKKDCKFIGRHAGTYHDDLSQEVTGEDVIRVFLSLSRVASLARQRAIIVLFDEAESIPSMGSWRRAMQAYINLLRIIQATQSEQGHILFVYATTPTFYSDLDGTFLSFLRLNDCADLADFTETHVRSNTLELNPLDEADLLKLGELIVKIGCRSQGKELDDADWDSHYRPLVENSIIELRGRQGVPTRRFVVALAQEFA